jgi:hypothetical protein
MEAAISSSLSHPNVVQVSKDALTVFSAPTPYACTALLAWASLWGRKLSVALLYRVQYPAGMGSSGRLSPAFMVHVVVLTVAPQRGAGGRGRMRHKRQQQWEEQFGCCWLPCCVDCSIYG